jgi:hypothetical protein
VPTFQRTAVVGVMGVAFSSNACVVHTVGTKIVHTAYIADGNSSESTSCLDRCRMAAGPQRLLEDTTEDLETSREQAKSVGKCVRRCPGVESRSNATCLEPGGGESSSCWDFVHKEPIREANPVAIVAIALGAAALTAYVVALLVGKASIPM